MMLDQYCDLRAGTAEIGGILGGVTSIRVLLLCVELHYSCITVYLLQQVLCIVKKCYDIFFFQR